MLAPVYMLDTNICIYAMKGQLSVLKKFNEHGKDALVISSLVAAELAYGVEKSQRFDENKRNLESFLQSMHVIAWDESAMWHFGQQRNRLFKAGTPISEIDLLLGCQALAMDVVFVTNNTREFERIEGLRLENWA
ncbi:type II toxin-antitoxin system tRNA(fMet)-specific endonuclease VapC [Polaromonas sp.]|uniref:type II toxin-antitoxin system tRNA(fMet)-specific endonuclease VapC n=1 Tax=Polaromonas sp. TaxID=1869339 RepID=UPI002FC6CE4E